MSRTGQLEGMEIKIKKLLCTPIKLYPMKIGPPAALNMEL